MMKEITISATQYQQLYTKLARWLPSSPELKGFLKQRLLGRLAESSTVLAADELRTKLWFIASGAVVIHYKACTPNDVFGFYYQDHFAVCAQSYVCNKPGDVVLRALPGTVLLELSYQDMTELDHSFSQDFPVQLHILVENHKNREKDTDFLRMRVPERIRAFHFGLEGVCKANPYPDIPAADIASYLNVSKRVYLKHYKNMMLQLT